MQPEYVERKVWVCRESRHLRLSGLAKSLPVRPQEANAGRLGHAEFLELILQDELNVRRERQLQRHTKAPDFRGLKSLEDFDWQFNASISRRQLFELTAGQYLHGGDHAPLTRTARRS